MVAMALRGAGAEDTGQVGRRRQWDILSRAQRRLVMHQISFNSH
jgi:hypothetical protein